MTIYYSPSKRGFYDTEINNVIPDDKVEVSKRDHIDLIQGQSSTKKIEPGPNGYPVLVEVQFSNEQLAAAAREKRNRLLEESDWTQFTDVLNFMSESKKQQWKTYRQELRDIPTQNNFPIDIIFPNKPE